MSKCKSRAGGAAVGYIRMSSDKQEESPDQQRDEILKLAAKHGYTIVRWYEDHAVSGVKTLKRKQFLQMIDDVKRFGDFQAILCGDQDRFGRFDSIEAGEWISPLRRTALVCLWLFRVRGQVPADAWVRVRSLRPREVRVGGSGWKLRARRRPDAEGPTPRP